MDFVRPNYKTVGDVLREEEEAAKKAAREVGEKIGREQGEKIGREKGEKIGREQGEKIGREAGAKLQAEETARRMLAQGEPVDKIVAYSGLTEERIKVLAAQKP